MSHLLEILHTGQPLLPVGRVQLLQARGWENGSGQLFTRLRLQVSMAEVWISRATRAQQQQQVPARSSSSQQMGLFQG